MFNIVHDMPNLAYRVTLTQIERDIEIMLANPDSSSSDTSSGAVLIQLQSSIGNLYLAGSSML